jgi:hypothetical protein
MNTADKIYEQVKMLPEPAVQEVLTFVEFMKSKTTSRFADSTKKTEGAGLWPKIVLDYTGDPDFPPFEAERHQLSEPHEDPLA